MASYCMEQILALAVLAGFVYINAIQTTKLLTPLPSEFMSLIFAMSFAGAGLGIAPVVLVLRLGGSGQVVWRNGMMALGAVPVSMFVMYHFAARIVADDLFRGGADRTFEAECRVSNFGDRSNNNAHVNCFRMGGIDLEISQSEYERLSAARAQAPHDANLGLCYRLTVQTAGRNLRLVLPSPLYEKKPQLITCKENTR